MSQATNPFNDALINDSEIVSNITKREELNLSQSTVSIRVPKPINHEESIILLLNGIFYTTIRLIMNIKKLNH